MKIKYIILIFIDIIKIDLPMLDFEFRTNILFFDTTLLLAICHADHVDVYQFHRCIIYVFSNYFLIHSGYSSRTDPENWNAIN